MCVIFTVGLDLENIHTQAEAIFEGRFVGKKNSLSRLQLYSFIVKLSLLLKAMKEYHVTTVDYY